MQRGWLPRLPHRAPSFSRHTGSAAGTPHPDPLWGSLGWGHRGQHSSWQQSLDVCGQSGWLGQTTAEGGPPTALVWWEEATEEAAGRAELLKPPSPAAGCWDWPPEASTQVRSEVDARQLTRPEVLVSTRGPGCDWEAGTAGSCPSCGRFSSPERLSQSRGPGGVQGRRTCRSCGLAAPRPGAPGHCCCWDNCGCNR